MSAEEFRRHGHAVVDWVADYLERVGTLPVSPGVEPGWVRARLPAHPPEEGQGFDGLLDELDRVVVPALTHWQHPSFFGYFPANTSGPAILGDLLSSGLGVQGMLWATSPACTEVEAHVLDWLAELLGLPARFRSGGGDAVAGAGAGPGGGVIQDSASSGTLCAVLAARERATGGRSNETGADGRLTVYTSAEAHSSVEKAVRVAGLGSANLRAVATGEGLAMDPALLDERMAADRADGFEPCIVVATVGTTSTGAVDPVRAVAEVCRRHGVWLHVDAAWAGTAALCPEHRWLLDGVDGADSLVVNPHKWMLTTFDCSAMYVADRTALTGALSIMPEYLRNVASESGAVVDYRDWQIQLGRRFRALKLWAVIRHYGARGLRAHVRAHVELAERVARRVAAHPDLELAVPRSLALVCFRHRAGDEASEALLRRLNGSGRLYLSHTRAGGRFVLRIAIGGVRTSAEHVDAAWEAVAAEARALA